MLAIYQPHGYGPTRFLRHDFVDDLRPRARADDRLWMLEVFYAGGTATRDFSAADIVAEIAANGAKAEFAPSARGSSRASPRRRGPATSFWSWARATLRSPISPAKLWQRSTHLPQKLDKIHMMPRPKIEL